MSENTLNVLSFYIEKKKKKLQMSKAVTGLWQSKNLFDRY